MQPILSSVPPGWPSPRPEIIGTTPPHAATMGASMIDTLSPTPPVECLSSTGPPTACSSQLSTRPECDMARVKATRSAAFMPQKNTAIAKAETWLSVNVFSVMPRTTCAISSSVSAWPSRFLRISSWGSTRLLVLARIEIEGGGQHRADGRHHHVLLEVGADDFRLTAELAQHLAAHAARCDGRRQVGDRRDGLELLVAGGDGLEHRVALGADCGAIGEVLDVAALEDRAVFGLERGADLEVRVRRIGALTHVLC